MAEEQTILESANGSVVAPAGYGKTETIVRVASKCKRSLILTHTHAGVQALRRRLRKHNVHHRQVQVDTLASWCIRYSCSFPANSDPPEIPPQGQAWEQLYRGTANALLVPAIRSVIASSYDRVLIDEYQDCDQRQHEVAVALSSIVRTTVFGDPLQGIFEFAGASLDWPSTVFPIFPLVLELTTPHRWKNSNPDLGNWIDETRKQLFHGAEIDLSDPRISWVESDNVFDMGVFFEGLDFEADSVAAIHCRKGICYSLAKASNGAFQAIEELEGRRMRDFARDWDSASTDRSFHTVVRSFFVDCFRKIEAEKTDFEEDATAVDEIMQKLRDDLEGQNPAGSAARLLHVARSHPAWRLFRSELWRDCERALSEVANGRCETMTEAAGVIRNRSNQVGRQLPRRTISTPLLLKGLEFQDVIIPFAPHFNMESSAHAKLFYVAISRATKSLRISSPEPRICLPAPSL